MHNFISMYRETLHTHFDWIGTLGPGSTTLTPELNLVPVLAHEALPPAYLGQATALLLTI